MDEILDATDGFLGLKGKKDDDFVDRLSSRYTVVVILVLAAVVTFYQFGGTLITCWCPVHFTDSHIKFTNSHCWVKNTYYLPWDDEVPREYEPRQIITYYQWIPFILMAQAFFFFLPSLVWHGLNQKGGIDSDNILATANTLHKQDDEENRENTVKLLTSQIHRFLRTRKTGQHSSGAVKGIKIMLSSLCSMCGRRVGSYLVMLYLISKALYIVNVLFQLFMLDRLLGTTFHDYGLDVLTGKPWSDHDWHNSPSVMFPRVTMCDFNVRRLGNVHRYSVQCALPLNLFNEKIYVFLWFWFVFVLICSILGFIVWVVRTLMPGDRLLFVQNHLTVMDRLETRDDKELSKIFVHDYLRQDGAFLLRLISHNTNNITTSEITASLWDFWLARYKDRMPNDKKAIMDEEDQDDTPLKGDENANASDEDNLAM